MDSLLESKAARRFERARRFLRNRFSAQNHLGLHLTLGVLVMIFAGWAFSEIAEMLGPGVTPPLDQVVTNWFHQHARPRLTELARFVTFFGTVGFLTAASAGCALFFLQRRAWNRLLALSSTMIGGALLNIVLKHFFHRQRPILENPLVTLGSFGFPSGHTMGAMLFYGVLALILTHAIRSWPWRVAAILTAGLIVTAIGLTRIYLGAHYLTDVLAAAAAGSVWLAFCWTTMETFRRRARRK